MTTQTALKAQIKTLEETLVANGQTVNFSQITRQVYAQNGLLEAYEKFDAKTERRSFMSSLPVQVGGCDFGHTLYFSPTGLHPAPVQKYQKKNFLFCDPDHTDREIFEL